jgi:hypothetical protein
VQAAPTSAPRSSSFIATALDARPACARWAADYVKARRSPSTPTLTIGFAPGIATISGSTPDQDTPRRSRCGGGPGGPVVWR